MNNLKSLRREIFNMFNSKQIQNKFKTNSKQIQNKFKTNSKQIQNKFKVLNLYIFLPKRKRHCTKVIKNTKP